MDPVVSQPERRLYRGELGRVNFEPTGRTLPIVTPLLYRLLQVWTKFDWRGGERVPASGPAIFVPNHISSLDPLLVGIFIAYNGRWPRFLARANLFDNKILGALLRDGGQIPVHRGSSRAADALVDAEAALKAGQIVVIYPEGTITTDPDEWPMAAHTGAARLALRTGAPVIPIGQWGANYALPSRGIRKFRLRRWPVTIACGEPVDLSDIGDVTDREQVRAATVKIMDAICALTERVRGEQAPEGRWLPKAGRRVERTEALI